MKITLISDTHNRHHKINLLGGDMLIHAGDATEMGTDREIYRFLDWFVDQPYEYKILIAGNHDFGFESDEFVAKIREEYPEIIYLQDELVEIEGLKIYGSPWQPEFGGWAFNLPRDGEELKRNWDLIPEKVDFLITHGPPFGRGDMLEDGREVGDQLLIEAITLKKPAVNVFGHIHAGRGLYEGVDTVFMNASVVNERYLVVHEPINIDYNPDSKTFEVCNA